MSGADALQGFRDLASEAGIFIDFDGTLSEIVSRPSQATAIEGAIHIVSRLVERYRVVAIVSGRPSAEVGKLLPVEGVRYFGLYGAEGSPDLSDVLPRVEEAALRVAGALVEHKGGSIAVHYREAEDPARARDALAGRLEAIAGTSGLVLIEGKMVLELVPRGVDRKAGPLRKIAREADLRAALFAGDDLPDLEAFRALDEFSRLGMVTLRVAVRGPETPSRLLDAADVVVEGPGGMVELLSQLA